MVQALRGHSESADVQEAGCGALKALAGHTDDEVKIAEMEGSEAVIVTETRIEAMRGHSESAGVQEADCGALGGLALRPDTKGKARESEGSL